MKKQHFWPITSCCDKCFDSLSESCVWHQELDLFYCWKCFVGQENNNTYYLRWIPACKSVAWNFSNALTIHHEKTENKKCIKCLELASIISEAGCCLNCCFKLKLRNQRLIKSCMIKIQKEKHVLNVSQLATSLVEQTQKIHQSFENSFFLSCLLHGASTSLQVQILLKSAS